MSSNVKQQIGTACANCGSTSDLSYHHIVPLSMGGNDVPSNMVCLCWKCHSMIHYGKEAKSDHSKAVRKGIARAAATGRKNGRKPADGERIMQAISEHSTQFGGDWTEDEIMESVGVRSVCYHKYKRQLLAYLESEPWLHDFPRPSAVRSMPLYRHVILQQRS